MLNVKLLASVTQPKREKYDQERISKGYISFNHIIVD